MQELEDVGKGMATQFEAGLLPAISDVGDALVDSLTQGGVSFKEIGKVAGDAVRGIAAIFLALGQTLGTVVASVVDLWMSEFDFIRNEGSKAFEALGQAARGNFTAAFNSLKTGVREGTSAVKEEVERQKAIYGTLGDSFKKDYADLFPSDEEEERRKKARLARLRPDKQTEAPELKPTEVSDAAQKAQLSLEEKLLQDQIALRRAFAKQAEAVDKEQYDDGLISLDEYYSRRRAQVASEAADEQQLLQQGLKNAQAEAARAASARDSAPNAKEGDKQEGQRLQALGKIDELQTKISESQINATTKQKQLDDEQQKAKLANNAELLEFEKQIDTSEEKRTAAAKAEIAVEKQKLALLLEQKGVGAQAAAAELARFEQAKLAQVDRENTQKAAAAVEKSLDAEKQSIQDRVKSGQLFQVQAEEQIKQAELARLPVLEALAAQLQAQAKASGSEEDRAKADAVQAKVDQIKVDVNTTGQQIATLKEGLTGALTSSFANFFETVGRGTESVATSFEKLAGSIISSLARMAAQMLAQIVVAKLLKAALGGFAGGGLVPCGGAGIPGHAEGGLIKGPGGPKADAIPARLSAGEYVVKADAVRNFGAHNLEAINRGLRPPSFEHLQLPKFAEGGLVGAQGAAGASGSVHLGIALDKGLILQHLTSKDAGRIILDHITNNPKAASKALGRSQG